MGQFNVTSDRLLLSPMSRHADVRDIHLCFAANTSLFWICIPTTDDLHPLCCSQQTKMLQVKRSIEHDLLTNDGCTTTTKQ